MNLHVPEYITFRNDAGRDTVILVKSGLKADIIPRNSLASNYLLAGSHRGGGVPRILIGYLYFPDGTGHRLTPILYELWKIAASFDTFLLGGNLNARHVTWDDSVNKDSGKVLFGWFQSGHSLARTSLMWWS